MGYAADDLLAKIRSLPDTEKLRLVDEILTQLDKPDPELDKVWADEARKRWEAYKKGRRPYLRNRCRKYCDCCCSASPP
jgi:hypothetical protein